MFTVDDARRYLLNLLPPGAHLLYDLGPVGDVLLLFDAIGEAFKRFAFDLLDTLLQEIFPSTCIQKLPDWETATGVENLNPALFGNTAQRQTSVISKLRESGAFCDPVAQSVLGLLLGYSQTIPVQLIKADRSRLRLEHTYSFAADVSLPPGQITNIPIFVNDGGKVARMGAQLTLTFADADLSAYTITLTAPDGRSKQWGLKWTSAPVCLFAQSLSGARVFGNWTLSIANGSIVANTIFAGSSLFVEGIGPNQDTGAAVFHWGVYANLAHVGENGVPADYPSVRAAIQRIKHSHTVGYLIQSLAPWPDVVTGAHSAIPDACIPI
jgi:hypothetical protein